MRVLVTGVSGYVGAALVPRLQAAGHEVRGFARAPERVTAAGVLLDDVVVGDAVSGAGLGRALDDVDADACCALLPTLVLVDATSAAGRALIVDLRSTTWGATVPLVAVTDGDDVPLAVDASVDVAQPAAAWAERVGYLLP
jgi:nucleoside-diphosphate-sugar epimerase